MKVIQPGTPQEVLTGKCSSCDCVFEFTRAECASGFMERSMIKCPNCGRNRNYEEFTAGWINAEYFRKNRELIANMRSARDRQGGEAGPEGTEAKRTPKEPGPKDAPN